MGFASLSANWFCRSNAVTQRIANVVQPRTLRTYSRCHLKQHGQSSLNSYSSVYIAETPRLCQAYQKICFAQAIFLRGACQSIRQAWTKPTKPRQWLDRIGTTISRQRLSTFSNTAVAKDVVLFEHDRTKFFRFLSLFCGGQFLFWTYLAHFAFTGLRDTRGGSNEGKKVRTELGGWFSFDMNLGSSAWRYGFTIGCLVVGGGIVGLGILFSRRSVSRVILHKGGRMVTVCTQSPLAATRGSSVTLPLSEVACHAHRTESPSFIPLKIKGHKFYYLLDKEGKINNLKLFDFTVGAYRPL